MAQTIDEVPDGPAPGTLAPIELDDLRTVLGGVTAGLSVQDETGRLIYVNADAAELSGFESPAAMLAATPAEIRARYELIDETGQPLDIATLPGRRALAGEPVDPLIVGFRLGDGAERWSIVRARAMELAGGRRVAVNTFIDITARIELEQRLRSSERRTQELAEERQRATELARMMADAALRLDEADDTDAVVQAAAESAVPILADWCVVDLLDDDGTLRRVGLAARDAALAAAIEPLRDHPAVREPNRASRRAVREGAAVIALDIDTWFAADPAPDPDHRRILVESGLRNAIAQPLVARGQTIGAIVFATVGERTFDDAAIAASAEMASRVGVSIANSQAHDAAQRARRAAEALAERERFLARATEVLASSLDYERTVQAVADLVVPAFADWCVVHVPGDSGVPRRIAVAHRDPDKVALAIRSQELYPPDPAAESGTAAILRTGKSEFMADIPPELVDAAARDDRHREILRALSLRSYISVPMMVSGRIIGVLSLVGSEGSRRFEPGDVAFAEALAARAAAAIETARLFREGVRFKRLLDATGDAILMIDPLDRRIEEVNRGAADQLQRPIDELVGSSIADHLDADGTSAFDRALADLDAAPTRARTVELELRRPDASLLPVEVRLETVTLDGSPPRILAISRDIRDRIEARERLRRLAEAEHARAAELNAVIEAMGEGVVVCDPSGRIILANPAAESTFPDVEETSYADILAQLEDPERRAPALGRRDGPVELRVRDEERWIEVSTWPVTGGPGQGGSRDGGGQYETIVLLRDVTEGRQRQLVRDTFIGVLSHELRTPVTTIYAGAKVLGRPGELDEPTRAEIFSDIVVESERLHRLVEDVVAMTRFGDEGGDVGAEPVLLQRLLPTVVASEQLRWPGVTFETEIAPGLPTVIADPTYVEQVVRNLLSNAAKYGGPATHVQVVVTAAETEVEVRILDDGPGFPPDEAERLFELFFRSAGTSRSAAGAGIGLFVCARLIRAMGGRIWATNRDGLAGSEFGFALRVMDEE